MGITFKEEVTMGENASQKKYLKFYQKLAYGSGDLASNCSYGLVSSFLLLYLTSVMGMNSAVIGTLMLVSKCVGRSYRCVLWEYN